MIASQLGIARATVSYHLAQLGAANARAYLAAARSSRMLARAGLRVSELCDLRLRDVRLQPREAAHCRIVDAKAAGIREVQLTPDLADRLARHMARLHAAGRPTGPDAYLSPNVCGGRISLQRVGRLLAEASAAASAEVMARGLPPLPTTTPHTLRRTFISIALLANGFDVKRAMSQVGHADSKMTLDVYAQLEQRADRTHGTSFDALLRRAQEARRGTDRVMIGSRGRFGGGSKPETAPRRRTRKARKSRNFERMARPGLEPGTPRFSVVCSTN